MSRVSEISPMAAVKAPRWRSPVAVTRFPQMAVNMSQGNVRGLAADVHLQLGVVGKEIDDSHRLVACWTQSTYTYTLAESSAVTAVLFAEVAGFAGWALVDRALPRSTRWDRRKWNRVTAPPRLLAAGRRTKALSADGLELGDANGAARHPRLADVTQREFSVHGHCPAPGCRAVRRPCRLSPGPISHYPQT